MPMCQWLYLNRIMEIQQLSLGCSPSLQEEDLSEDRASCWDALHKEEHCCRGLESWQMPSRPLETLELGC